jgi:hypothetical protein
MFFHPITVTAPGRISTLYLYARATGAYRMALYDDGGGQPGSVLAQSVPATLSGALAAYYPAEIDDVAVSGGGTVYWVALWGETGLNYSGFNTPPDTAFSLAGTNGVFPDPFSGGTATTRRHRNFALLCQ